MKKKSICGGIYKMRKPIIVFRRQKSIAAILLSAVILFIGILLIFEDKNDSDTVPVFAEQNENSKPNETIADFLGRIMEG